VECEDIRLEQGLANLFGDRLESKIFRLCRPRGHAKIKGIYKTKKTTYAQIYLFSDTCIAEYSCA
jgi:hypothetical protein